MDNTKISKFKAFVIMPYGNKGEYKDGKDESDYIYKRIIKKAVESIPLDNNAKPEIIRELDRNQGGSITTAIVKALLDSDVVIVDVTGRNPNVFLELGIRYVLRNKITIMIAQKGTEIPFDIKGYRYIEYNKFNPEETRDKIVKFIEEGFKKSVQSDSVVFDVFPTMSVIIPGIAESKGPEVLKKGEMRWEDYIERIRWVCRLLENPVKNGTFTPDALIGISNGGLIVLDIVGRELFNGKPILSLWADRFDSDKGNFFENPFNQSVIGALKKKLKLFNKTKKDGQFTILLFDDHIGTGKTSLQATQYLEKKLGDNISILFIPIVSRKIRDIPMIEKYLPYQYQSSNGNKIFSISKEEFISEVDTECSSLPYFDKEIITY